MKLYKTDEDVEKLFKDFENRTLSKADWTHAAHLTVALVYCLRFPAAVARNLMRDGIHWLNDAHGTPNTETSGYHETLTCFWMAAVNDFLNKNDSAKDLAVLANELTDGRFDAKLPLKFYSRELLFSTEARFSYIAPDLAADLDFTNLAYNKIPPGIYA